jgi:quinol monooxygenase YgiN
MGDRMIVNTLRITLRPEKRREFFQTIGRLLDPIKKAQGCLAFRCYVDSNDENSSLLIGEWETESDLNKYLRSDDFAILQGAIKILSIQSTDCQALITQVLGRHPAPKSLSEMGNGPR